MRQENQTTSTAFVMPSTKSRIAIIGSGAAGLVSAYLLHTCHDITLFERNHYFGGHVRTILIPDSPDAGLPVDTGFIVYNDRNYPTFIKLLAALHIEGQPGDMSFGFSDRVRKIEYSSYVPFGLFAQKRNLLRPEFLRMIRDILRFNRQASADLLSGFLSGFTLSQYLARHKFSQPFQDYYLIPMGAAIWSTSPREMFEFPMQMFAQFFFNHGLLALKGRPAWKTIPGGSHSYVKAILSQMPEHCHASRAALSVRRDKDGVWLTVEGGRQEKFDYVVIATHADEALHLLANPTADEKRLLGAWTYTQNRAVLHTDKSFMPIRKAAWASWNYRTETRDEAQRFATLTYHMNRLQRLSATRDYFVTLNPVREIPKEQIIRDMIYTHPRYTVASLATQPALRALNGTNQIFYCGSYLYNGFHEDAVKSAVDVTAHFGITL